MDIVEEMRGFEIDHGPEDWPGVRMRQVSALCDEIERLRSYLEYDANCPCCDNSVKCEDGCTFADDAPDAYEHMMEVRAVLKPHNAVANSAGACASPGREATES